ncbi:hypothetical protein BGX34_002214 [Mortierella sp. NVP85]|nr:hypothetical protein BGX34_002214 [Mortierella sp. NVP85]
MSAILQPSLVQPVTNEVKAPCFCNAFTPDSPCNTCWLRLTSHVWDELKAGHLNSFHFKEEPNETSPQFVVDQPMSDEPEQLVSDVGFETALTTSKGYSTSRRSSGTGARGESTPISRKRLTDEIKRRIKDGRINEGMAYQELADELRCSKSAAWRIVNEIRHKNLMAWKNDPQRAHTLPQMTHTMPQMPGLQGAHTMSQLRHTTPQMLDLQMAQMMVDTD